MKMEVKVDVHAVHPAKQANKGPIGSWCSPEIKAEERSTKCATSHSSVTPVALPKRDVDLEESLIEQQEEIELPRIESPKKSTKCATSLPPSVKPVVFPKRDLDLEESLIEQLEEIELPRVESPKSAVVKYETPPPPPPPPARELPQSPVPSPAATCTLPAAVHPRVAIDPQGRGYITWLFLVTFTYSYNAWCVTLRATFPYQTPENTPIWMTIDYICDLIYILDVAYVKPRLMYLDEGFWVDDPKLTRRNYRKKVQYKFDVISLIPLDLLYLWMGPQHVMLRLPRLLKVQTFWEFHQAVDRMLSSPHVVRIGKMLYYIFYLIHLNACSYYAMSVYEGLGSNGWVYDNQGNAYIRCFYFAFKTATSIGKNPKPENLTEYMYMTCAWLMGVFVFAALISQIRYIIATATRAKTEYRMSLDKCTNYLRRLNMPADVQRRVTAWHHYTWREQRYHDESKILNVLPYKLKLDVALDIHMPTLSKVQVFRDCSEGLLRDLVLQLRPLCCLPGDAVVRRGDAGHHMYIVQSGECCVMSEDETEVVACLREGSVFGEICLLGLPGMQRRTATVRSRGYSNLFALSRSDLEAALEYHKEARMILRSRADQIIRENSARAVRERTREERQALKSAIRELRQRRASSASSGSAPATEGKRAASAASKRRLTVLSENKGQPANKEVSACPNFQIPTIIFTSE